MVRSSRELVKALQSSGGELGMFYDDESGLILLFCAGDSRSAAVRVQQEGGGCAAVSGGEL